MATAFQWDESKFNQETNDFSNRPQSQEPTNTREQELRDQQIRTGEDAIGAAREGLAYGQEGVDEAQAGLAWELDQFGKANAAFEDTFGSVITNMKNFYATRTPDNIAAMGLRDSQVRHQQQVESIKKNNALRGFDSPVTDEQVATENIRFAEDKALVRAGAEEESMKGQQDFLTLGMNLRQQKENLGAGVRGARNAVQTARSGMQGYNAQLQSAYGRQTNSLSTIAGTEFQRSENKLTREAAVAAAEAQRRFDAEEQEKNRKERAKNRGAGTTRTEYKWPETTT